jgi:ADP-dependent NAD(P)H-hydrate dehydratase / NAD(P)H-hydrate epimerase
MILVTARQMQSCDRRTIEEIGLPGMVLMENAAQGAVKALLEALGGPEGLRVAALCGRGNNGGDGLAILRILANQGALCTAYLMAKAEDYAGDAAVNLAVAARCGVEIRQAPDEEAFDKLAPEMACHQVYVDALLGTGLSKPVTGRYLKAIELLNQLAAPVLAVDIPSGLSADSGAPLGAAVTADFTATFGLLKQGLVIDPLNHAGEISLVDISIPPLAEAELDIACHLLEPEMAAGLLPPRPQHGHKGSFGHLLVVGGGPGKSGAPCLAAMGGLRAGAGLVTVALPSGLNQVAETKLTAVMSQPLPQTSEGGLAAEGLEPVLEMMESRSVLALGPGLGTGAEAVQLARELARRCPKPLVIDADGLNALVEAWADLSFASGAVVLTPHPGEAARLLGLTPAQVQADRLAAARRLAAQSGAVAVLKGAKSIIAEPGGVAWINPSGGPLLASGGSGDVLTGLIAGLMAQGAGALEAALAGAFVHGLAAELAAEEFGLRGLAAEELLDYLPGAFASLEVAGEPEEPEAAHEH